ncbi:MAG: outer membrane beta-barrel domain-containing protein [Myxococcota bacterium]
MRRHWLTPGVLAPRSAASSLGTPLGRCAILVIGLLGMGTATAEAQDMTFDIEEAEEEGTEETEGTGEEGGSDMVFGEEEATGEGEGEGEVGLGEEAGDVIGDLALDTGPVEESRDRAPRSTESVEEIYAVQQIFALRINRVELAPAVGFTLNDPYTSHTSLGVGLNYWFTNVLAVGINFLWYQGLENESDLNFFVRRSTRLAIPIVEYQLGAHLNFTYVPVYGKFMMFNEFIFQWDAYVLGGVGLMRTRPVPVIDPEVRQFEFDWRVAFNIGIGLRVFVTRWLAVFAELRDYAYLERLESLDVQEDRGRGAAGECPQDSRCDPNTWIDDSVSFENNVTAHIGFTIFFPFDFEYRLPK